MANDDKSASQFISALVKNLQAVCHGHVEFDKNVKVVGHLYLTVDSGSEFNYIVNEKVSKSDESSTTFISKSFYATDPQQKTPKKNLDRPLPPPTPNVLGKTRYDISVDLTDEPPVMGGRFSQRGQFSRPQGYPGMNRHPQARRRPFDQNRFPSHQMAKMPRLSPQALQRQAMNFPQTSPRKLPSSPSQRTVAPSTITSSSPSIPSPVSIPPELVSATPAHSLPGADKPEDSTNKVDTPDIKFEVIKVEKGSDVSSNKESSEGEKGDIRIESVTSHDLSLDIAASTDESKEGEEGEVSEKPPDNSSEETSDKNTAEQPSELNLDTENPPSASSSEAQSPLKTSDSMESKQRASKEPEVIEIDLTSVKDEIDSVLDSDSSYMFDNPSGSQQRFSGQGDNSLSSYGGDQSNDDDFFNSLREQTVGLYPVGLHANESNNQGYPDIPNLPGTQGAYMPVAGTSSSPSSNQPDGTKCAVCKKMFATKSSMKRHVLSAHLNMRYTCPICQKSYSQVTNLKEHMAYVHKEGLQFYLEAQQPIAKKS